MSYSSKGLEKFDTVDTSGNSYNKNYIMYMNITIMVTTDTYSRFAVQNEMEIYDCFSLGSNNKNAVK